MATENATDVRQLVSRLQLHLTAARSVLQGAREAARALGCGGCLAARLLLLKADEIHNEIDEATNGEWEALFEPEFVHSLEGAIDVLDHGIDNDLGNDNPDSGLSLSAVALLIRALETADDVIERAGRDALEVARG
jgi:hypothetical protein